MVQHHWKKSIHIELLGPIFTVASRKCCQESINLCHPAICGPPPQKTGSRFDQILGKRNFG